MHNIKKLSLSLKNILIHPYFNEHFNVPTIYDEIKIGDKEITMKNNVEMLKSFNINLKPSGNNNENIKRAEDIQAILQKTYNDTLKIISNSLEQKDDAQSLKSLQLDIKSVLENYRSLLDYTAHFIAQKCDPIPSENKVYFPIASKSTTEYDFTKKIKKDFPNLDTNCNVVFDYLIHIQHFNNDNFLIELNELVNKFKHRSLAQLKLKKYYPILVSCGNIGFRIGELGFNSIKIEKNGKLIFDNVDKKAIIEGPCTITELNFKNYLSIENINITKEEYNLLTPDGSAKSITGLLWTFSINILRVINNICVNLK